MICKIAHCGIGAACFLSLRHLPLFHHTTIVHIKRFIKTLYSSVVALHCHIEEKKTSRKVSFDDQHFKICLVPRAESSIKDSVYFH